MRFASNRVTAQAPRLTVPCRDTEAAVDGRLAGVPLEEAVRHAWTVTRAPPLGLHPGAGDGRTGRGPGELQQDGRTLGKGTGWREPMTFADEQTEPRPEVLRALRGSAKDGATVRELVQMLDARF